MVLILSDIIYHGFSFSIDLYQLIKFLKYYNMILVTFKILKSNINESFILGLAYCFNYIWMFTMGGK